MKSKTIDWAAIKTAYITGDESQRALCKRFGVGYSALAEKCRKEGWVEARAKWRRDTVAKATQKASRTRARELAKIIEASDALDDVLAAFLKKIATEEEGMKLLTLSGNPGRELESLSKAILNSDELKRRLNGMLMPRDEARIKLDREKLEMEKKKMEEEKTSENNVKVEFADGSMKEYAQ